MPTNTPCPVRSLNEPGPDVGSPVEAFEGQVGLGDVKAVLGPVVAETAGQFDGSAHDLVALADDSIGFRGLLQAIECGQQGPSQELCAAQALGGVLKATLGAPASAQRTAVRTAHRRLKEGKAQLEAADATNQTSRSTEASTNCPVALADRPEPGPRCIAVGIDGRRQRSYALAQLPDAARVRSTQSGCELYEAGSGCGLQSGRRDTDGAVDVFTSARRMDGRPARRGPGRAPTGRSSSGRSRGTPLQGSVARPVACARGTACRPGGRPRGGRAGTGRG